MSESDCGVNVGICTKIEARTSFLFELFFPLRPHLLNLNLHLRLRSFATEHT